MVLHQGWAKSSNTNFSNIAISGAPTAPKVGFQHPSSACGENASLQPSPSDRAASAGSFFFQMKQHMSNPPQLLLRCTSSSLGALFHLQEAHETSPEAMQQSGAQHRCHTDTTGLCLNHRCCKSPSEAEAKKGDQAPPQSCGSRRMSAGRVTSVNQRKTGSAPSTTMHMGDTSRLSAEDGKDRNPHLEAF